MKPHPVEGLEYVTAFYQSVHGEIKSAWHKHDAHFHWEISIPANTSATVYIPAKDVGQISEGAHKSVLLSEGLKFTGMENDHYAVFEVGSGDYSFLVGNE
jgi:alpha-L-rhamnosidase